VVPARLRLTDTVTNTPVALTRSRPSIGTVDKWADYDKVAIEVVAPLGDILVSPSTSLPASSSSTSPPAGHAAIPAARGEPGVATDLTPELLETDGGEPKRPSGAGLAAGRRRHLPYSARPTTRPHHSGDVAPFHQPVADELGGGSPGSPGGRSG